MDPKWIQVLLVLLFCQKITSATHVKAKEGKEVSLYCKPKINGASMVIWFRVLDQSNMEFIASVALSGQIKKSAPNFDQTFRQSDYHTFVLKSFQRQDSGIYCCAALVSGNKLEFGEVTKLEFEKEIKTTTKAPAPLSTMQPTPPTRTCDCKDKTDSSMFCAPIILGPLAGGCGLLLLLLIISTLYCNKMRTRRCPHHHRRKPRIDALEKQMMVNRHV